MLSKDVGRITRYCFQAFHFNARYLPYLKIFIHIESLGYYVDQNEVKILGRKSSGLKGGNLHKAKKSTLNYKLPGAKANKYFHRSSDARSQPETESDSITGFFSVFLS